MHIHKPIKRDLYLFHMDTPCHGAEDKHTRFSMHARHHVYLLTHRLIVLFPSVTLAKYL